MKRILVYLFLMMACSEAKKPQEPAAAFPVEEQKRKAYAIVIHGGTNGSREIPLESQNAHLKGLTEALKIGQGILQNGGTSLDAVEQTIRYLEDHVEFNAGKGASLTSEFTHELDAAVMDGRDLSCGAVAGVSTVKNPISLARMVMENTPHVLFSGEGAEKFAEKMEVQRVSNDYFTTEEKVKALERKLMAQVHTPGELHYGTVGVVALDIQGNLAAGTSTGGTTAKATGRVGDSPIIGAGTYADNRTCAISCTGKGEEFMRNNIAHDISAMIDYRKISLREAMDIAVHKKLKPQDGGIIGVDRFGNIHQAYNTIGMYRGSADSEGLFEVRIWE